MAHKMCGNCSHSKVKDSKRMCMLQNKKVFYHNLCDSHKLIDEPAEVKQSIFGNVLSKIANVFK